MNRPIVTVVGSFAVGMTLCTQRMPIFGETLVGFPVRYGPRRQGSKPGSRRRPPWEQNPTLLELSEQTLLEKIARALYEEEGVRTEYLVETNEKATGVGFNYRQPRRQQRNYSRYGRK